MMSNDEAERFASQNLRVALAPPVFEPLQIQLSPIQLSLVSMLRSR